MSIYKVLNKLSKYKRRGFVRDTMRKCNYITGLNMEYNLVIFYMRHKRLFPF